MDYIFYSGIIWGKDTFDSGHAPVWRFVAKHAKFLPKVNLLARRHLEKAFGISKGKRLPPVRHLTFISLSKPSLTRGTASRTTFIEQFIAMHIRRSDFEGWCKSGIPKEDCLPQPSTFALRVKEIQEELGSRELDDTGKVANLDVKHVLITSDEPKTADSQFWREVRRYGWVTVDHVKERTEEKYGGCVAHFFFLCMFISRVRFADPPPVAVVRCFQIFPSCGRPGDALHGHRIRRN